MKNIVNLYFSPTGNACQIGEAVASGLSESLGIPVGTVDMTRPAHRRTLPAFTADTLVVVTMPVYAGRLPNKILPELQRLLKGEKTPAVTLVTYGNRHFDDALSELVMVLKEAGFLPVAGAAVPSEHAFSKKIASGRPDEADLSCLKAFGKTIAEMLQKGKDPEFLSGSLDIPGNNPPGPYYTPLGIDGKPAKFLKAKPLTDPALCTACGTCAEVCPMGSISETDLSDVFGICIKCQACIRSCPEKAKFFDDAAFLSHVAMLEDFASAGKEIEFFYDQE